MDHHRHLYNSEQKRPIKKKHSSTRLYINLPDAFMKEMKRKLKQKFILLYNSTGVIKIYLLEF